MKDINGKILFKGEEYTLVFNLNVMEAIQEEYGSVAKWGEMAFDTEEPKIKPLKFAFALMVNEGIEIENEDRGTARPLITVKQAGRMISEMGIEKAAETIGDLAVASAGDDSKNE